MTLEEITAYFLKTQLSRDGRWHVQSLWQDRLYATRASDGAFGLFVRGPLADFGRLPRSTSISHEDNVLIEPVGTSAPMLRVIAPAKTQGNRALAYVAYEALRLLEANPDLAGANLLQRLLWMLVLLEDESVIMSPERQRGLVGELQLLARLVRRAQANKRSPSLALDRWHGPWSAKRDFAASGIAVEVKTTGDDRRIHTISSLSQLEPQDPTEEVFVYSLGVRHDYSSPRRLHHFVRDVEVLLDVVQTDEFHRRLEAYGFDSSRPELYDSEPGVSPFHLAPSFFAESGLVRLRSESFVGGRPPPPVTGISYCLMLTGEPIAPSKEEALLDRLLS